MSRSLSFDAILAALTLISVTTGCSKTESAAPAPETNAPATKATATAAASATAAAAPAVTAAALPTTEGSKPGEGLSVDAGKEMKTGGAKKGPAASCGATGCSPDMKKNK